MGDRRTVLLASGGLDSTVMAYWLRDQGITVLPIFVDYGQHSATTELEAARETLPRDVNERLQIARVSGLYSYSVSLMLVEVDLWSTPATDEDFYVPYRNQLLLTLGAAYAASRAIPTLHAAFIESNLANGVDCTTQFLASFRANAERFGGVLLQTPFERYSKSDVARIGISLGVPLAQTYSCLARARTPCGACANCVDRGNALSHLQQTE